MSEIYPHLVAARTAVVKLTKLHDLTISRKTAVSIIEQAYEAATFHCVEALHHAFGLSSTSALPAELPESSLWMVNLYVGSSFAAVDGARAIHDLYHAVLERAFNNLRDLDGFLDVTEYALWAIFALALIAGWTHVVLLQRGMSGHGLTIQQILGLPPI